ncbi:hypothetical protein HBI43_021370 [Parastagonospora nodorum]|nr:hypothetical protein HBI43_021370 [Parastagonospora nodorum]
MPIKNNDNLLNTINSHIKLRKLKEVREADALKQVDVNRLELEAQLRKVSKEEELAKTKKEKREKELIGAYILYFKELLSNNSKIFASVIGITRTQAIVLLAIIEHKNKVVVIDSVNSTLCDLSNPLVVRFCIFSNPTLENIGILTNKKVVEMQTNTATALANKLAAVNKLVRLQTFTLKILEHVETIILKANTPAVHSKAIKHCLALLAAQFVIVCSFRKVDKHMFRAYNTISVTAQQTIICKGSSYIEKRAILLSSYITFNATNKRDSITSNCIYKIEDIRNIIANIKHNASEHKSSYKDILEKESLNKLEASRRVIFNCFKMQAIASYSALATLKAAHVKNLFTNLSKDYFLSIIAEDAAKVANILLLLKEVCAKILIESYKLIVQALAEMCVSIVYFNLDSKLELKVLGK